MKFLKEEAGCLAYFLLIPVFVLGLLGLMLSLSDNGDDTVYAIIGCCIVVLLMASIQCNIVGIQYKDEEEARWREEAARKTK